MLSVIESFNQFAEGWAGLMWAVLWQSTLLIGAVTLLAGLLRRSSPVVRYWLWQIVAIKLLLMPFWTWAVPLPSLFDGEPDTEPVVLTEPGAPLLPDENSLPREAGTESQANPIADTPPATRITPPWYRQITWQSWLLSGWAVIVFVQIVRVLWLRVRLGQLLRTAVPASGELPSLLRDATALLDLKRVPRVVLTDLDCSPFVCGVLRPVVVLPESLAASFDPKRMQQVLLHELAHVKRHDLLWGWIPETARMFYFFHPLVYWVSNCIRLEQEACCDQLAMAHSGRDAADYADMLVKVVSHASEPAMLKTAAATSAGLDGKESILKGRQHP